MKRRTEESSANSRTYRTCRVSRVTCIPLRGRRRVSLGRVLPMLSSLFRRVMILFPWKFLSRTFFSGDQDLKHFTIGHLRECTNDSRCRPNKVHGRRWNLEKREKVISYSRAVNIIGLEIYQLAWNPIKLSDMEETGTEIPCSEKQKSLSRSLKKISKIHRELDEVDPLACPFIPASQSRALRTKTTSHAPLLSPYPEQRDPETFSTYRKAWKVYTLLHRIAA